jgi:type IV secretion system protein VirB6
VLNTIRLVAGECLNFGDKATKGLGQNIGKVVKGFICAAFVVVVGCFALLEYLIAYVEFLFVSSVGVILFPLTLYEGSKPFAEGYIKAMVGFFVKLLFCTICIFLMLYGYLSLANRFSANNFTGTIEEIIQIVFSSLLFFYICKSAPALAQSLLSGNPSLNAAGAIGVVTGAVGGAMAAGRIASNAGQNTLGAAAKGGIGAISTVAQARGAFGSASDAVKSQGGSIGQQRSAGFAAARQSVFESAGESIRAGGGDVMRSLMARPLIGNSPHGGGQGTDRFSAADNFRKPNPDGTRKTMGEFWGEQKRSRSGMGNKIGMQRAHDDTKKLINDRLKKGV